MFAVLCDVFKFSDVGPRVCCTSSDVSEVMGGMEENNCSCNSQTNVFHMGKQNMFICVVGFS